MKTSLKSSCLRNIMEKKNMRRRKNFRGVGIQPLFWTVPKILWIKLSETWRPLQRLHVLVLEILWCLVIYQAEADASTTSNLLLFYPELMMMERQMSPLINRTKWLQICRTFKVIIYYLIDRDSRVVVWQILVQIKDRGGKAHLWSHRGSKKRIKLVKILM